MQFLWLILLLGTGPSCVLFLMFSLLHLWVHQMPSFLLKIFFCKQTRKEPCNPIYVWAAGWATLPWKQLELILSALSALPSWRHVDIMFVKTSPFSDDMGGRKNWLQYSWAPDWVVQVSFVQQTSWQMTVRCDHGCGMWHALWKRFFLL